MQKEGLDTLTVLFASRALPDYPDRYRIDCLHHFCEPHEGIEPSSTPYEGAVLPLN